MSRFMVTINARFLDDDNNELDEFSTCADGDSADWSTNIAQSEIGTNLYDWMREKESGE